MYEKIRVLLQKALTQTGIRADNIHIERPADFSHGDFASNVAMQYAPQIKKKPRELAEEITRYIEETLPKEIEKVEIAGPGFINFYLSKEYFLEKINEILKQNEKYGKNNLLKDKKVIVEYTDANPFKEFHIGHLMNNAIGESLSRIIAFSGAEVRRANYQGDVGLHVAKAVWGKVQKSDISWGDAYVHGVQNYEQNKEEINEINKKIYEKSDKKINALYEEGKKLSLKLFEILYKLLGTKFDFYFFESESGPVGLGVVKKHPDVFEKSDNAIVFYGEKFDKTLHTRVFVTKEGLPTYEAKELGLAKMKYEKYPYDISYIVTGNEVKDYFRVVYKAMEQVFPGLAEKTIHIPHGMLRLPAGKMSSRTGDVVSAESLLRDIKDRVLQKMKNANVENKEKIADQVAVGAVKYSILRSAAGSDIVFDFEKSISFEGDSGPYLQYTYARARSVLRTAEDRGISPNIRPPARDSLAWAGRITQNITDVERLIERFPETVARAYAEREPHYITTYLTQLAGAFNAFYAKERIVPALNGVEVPALNGVEVPALNGVEVPALNGVEVDASSEAPYRLALTEATATILKSGLWLLGIEAPEKM